MPRHPYQDGRIYVIEFSSGAVKVGYTRSPALRFDHHHKTARIHGAAITNGWLSPPHDEHRVNEDKLISFCLKHFGPPIVGHEFFKPADFRSVCAYAACLDFSLEEPVIDDGTQGYAVSQLTQEIRGISSLRKYIGDEAANEAIYLIAQRLMRLTPPAWAASDPDACLRYLTTRGAAGDVSARVENFEVSVRALFALTFQRDPETFAELAEYMDARMSGPAVLV